MTSAADLAVIVPTRGRLEILDRTLDSLAAQTVSGFETIVVVDGNDAEIPNRVRADRVIAQEHAGPGAARNRGVAETTRPIVLFLGDDMIPTPTLVAHHLDGHRRHPEPTSAVLSHTQWHPSVAKDRLARWLDWSGFQFDYHNIHGDDAGWGRFYSSNTSLKRDFFLSTGGFDEDFVYDYEDLDLAWRLHGRGLRLWYEPRAVAHHLHHYDWASLARRWESHASAERLMQTKHEWFAPFFASAVQDAVASRRASALWPVIEPWVPRQLSRVQAMVRERTTRRYLQQLAPAFLTAWNSEPELAELKAYLGDGFEVEQLQQHAQGVDRERHAAPDDETFYRTSQAYLYDLTAFAMSGTKRPYFTDLRAFVSPGSRVLDYGCGIGSDGLQLLADGYRVEFADFANPSTEYLRWRLDRRESDADVYELDTDDIPAGFDAAYSIDVIEHVDDPFEFLRELERRAAVVMVNFLEPEPGETDLHRPLPIRALLDHAHEHGILRYRRYHDRSHLVIYRTPRPGLRGRVRSILQRRLGAHLRGSL